MFVIVVGIIIVVIITLLLHYYNPLQYSNSYISTALHLKIIKFK